MIIDDDQLCAAPGGLATYRGREPAADRDSLGNSVE
jgi:hypothetical protein